MQVGSLDLTKEKDYQTELTQRKQFLDSADFTYSFPLPTDLPENPAGTLIGMTVDQLPLLGVLPARGVAQAVATLEACAVNQPHVHPRGTELVHVLKGGQRHCYCPD